MAGAVERWSAFLEKIEERQGELLAGAEEALPQLVDLSGFDLGPFSVALMAVRAQCIELSQKIDRTWNGQAEAALEEAGANVTAELERRSAVELRMQLSLRRTEVKIAADAAQKVVAKAREILGAGFKCTRCGAPLSPRAQFFRSQYVTCG